MPLLGQGTWPWAEPRLFSGLNSAKAGRGCQGILEQLLQCHAAECHAEPPPLNSAYHQGLQPAHHHRQPRWVLPCRPFGSCTREPGTRGPLGSTAPRCPQHGPQCSYPTLPSLDTSQMCTAWTLTDLHATVLHFHCCWALSCSQDGAWVDKWSPRAHQTQ